MTSFLGKKWNKAQEIGVLEDFIDYVLKKRGLKEHKNINDFLKPKLSQLHDPFLMYSMGKAIERIIEAIAQGERIVIFGDFDADGITSTVILVHALRKIGARVSYRIPDRVKDGHGLKTYLIDEIATKDVSLIITCDCGVNDQKEVEYAVKNGIDVIISDHHTSDEKRFPNKALAVINPKIPQCDYPEKNLSGAGVAFKIASALAQKVFEEIGDIANFLEPYLEIAAIGLVADCVPLTGENRILTSFGLEKMKDSSWSGLTKMKERSNVDSVNIDTETIGFCIAPRLNAASRLGDVLRATELFLGDDSQHYERLTYLESLNEKRKVLTKEHIESAQEQVEKDAHFQFLLDANWQAGILGLMASHISEKMSHPVFAGIEKEDGTITFSARAPAGYSIVEGLNSCDPELFLGFGGHSGAGGFQAKKENAMEIQKSLQKYFEKTPKKELSINIEAIVLPQMLNFELTEFLSLIAPFGIGNLTPVFCITNIEIENITLLGKDRNHLRINGLTETDPLEFLGFFLGNFSKKIEIGKIYDICFTVSENTWRGKKRLQLKLVDMKPSF